MNNAWVKIKKHKVIKKCLLCGKTIDNPHQNKLYCNECLVKIRGPKSVEKISYSYEDDTVKKEDYTKKTVKKPKKTLKKDTVKTPILKEENKDIKTPSSMKQKGSTKVKIKRKKPQNNKEKDPKNLFNQLLEMINESIQKKKSHRTLKSNKKK